MYPLNVNCLRVQVVVALAAIGLFGSASGQSDWTGEVLVSPKALALNKQKAKGVDLLGGQIKQVISGPEIYVVIPPSSESPSEYMKRLRLSGQFRCVAPNQYAHPTAAPNDANYTLQWHLPHISAPTGWNFTTGNATRVVAVCDSGVDLTHPDLVPNLVPGYNCISNLPQASGGNVSDIHSTGHGTRTMGIAVAAGNNGIGVSGTGWGLKGMPIRVTDSSDGTTTVSELLEGVSWAINNGAYVASVSYDQVANSSVETVGAWARSVGALLVWSAGNANTELASFDHFDVTIVGATDKNDVRLSTSNYGRAVDIYAPGTLIYTTRKGGLYGNAPAGTSFATPQVAATMALVKIVNPGFTPEQVERRVLLSCRDLGNEGCDSLYRFGRLNMGLAVWGPPPTWTPVELSVPITSPNVALAAINDVGDKVATASNTGLIYYPSTGLPTYYPCPAGYSLGEINGLNNSGTVIGTLIYSSPTRVGFSWTASGGFVLNNSIHDSYYVGINSSGDIIGTEQTMPFIIHNGVKSRIFDSLLGGYFSGRTGDGNCINDFGHIGLTIPSTGNDGFFALGYQSSVVVGCPYPTRTTYFYGLSNSGYAIGTVYDNGGGAIAARARLNLPAYSGGEGFSLNWDLSTDVWSTHSEGWGVNDYGEAVVSLDRYAGQGRFSDGVTQYNLTDRMSVQPSSAIQFVAMPRDINERGDIAATGIQYAGNKKPLFLRRDRDVYLTLDLGQLGASPTYIGSIPPVVAVQYGNDAGVFQPDVIMTPYQSGTGKLLLSVPRNNGGMFRVRLSCNSGQIPGYQGPGYLTKIFPPIGIQALPLDAIGQETIELFQGDCDNDNEIGAGDFDFVVSHFGTVDGEPEWSPSADINGDGEVGSPDFDIVVENYGLSGD